MTPEEYYAVHLVSSVLPLTATTHFLPDRSGNDTGNLNRKSLTCNLQVTSNSIALQTTLINKIIHNQSIVLIVLLREINSTGTDRY